MTEETAVRVKALVAENFGVEPDAITPTFELTADSLSLTEVVVVIEHEFECTISDDEAQGVVTFQDLMQLLSKKGVGT